MPVHGVDLEDVGLETEGFSGADLKAVCQQAAVEAMIRGKHDVKSPAITADDMAKALAVETTAVANNAPPPRTSEGHRPLRARRH
jgi:ATP-dependent 26S proteasome regulatory subunit